MEKKIHPIVIKAQEKLRQGRLSRREFLRTCTLLGASLATANLLAACGSPEESAAPTDGLSTGSPERIQRGGTLTCASRVERVDHPARFSLASATHSWRHVLEYLTYTNPQAVTEPVLLESWSASDDLLTWTLVVRKGIKFSNGKGLTADDVVFNFQQWLNPDIGSSILGTMSNLSPDGVSKQDDYTVVLRLNSPTIFIPEHLAQYPAAIVPAGFGGDITKEPIGTGPFTMEEYVAGERCRLKARKDYWRMGKDGQPLPYLDEIVMVQLGEDRSADVAALQSGQVDTILEPTISNWEALKDNPDIIIVSSATGATRALRVRVDQEPWTKNEVRQAIKHCHNREKILALALQGQGVIGNDSHVSPAQPEFVDIPPYPYDTAKSKELLAQAGYPDGVSVELTVASDWPESMAYAQALKEDASAGGFDITLKTMPASQYWDGWTEWNMGITWWAHRTLAPMILRVAYTADADGKPVPWNESRWLDPEFDEILTEAERTLDLPKRRDLVGQLITIQKERGSICTPFFLNVWKIYSRKVHDVPALPDEYGVFHETWKEA